MNNALLASLPTLSAFRQAALGALVLMSIGVSNSFAATASAAPKADLAKGQASYAAVCASCHGADGNSTTPANPKLAGQGSAYLVKQLKEFKEGKRANAVMQGFAATLNEQDMLNIATWLSTQKPKAGFAKDKDLVLLGERIYRGGIASKQVAACAGCHSPTGAGIPAQYPRVSGQHADYAAAQLTAFRTGARANSIQMTGVASKMSDQEIKAVSDYMAGLR